jgi:hypothetical protein
VKGETMSKRVREFFKRLKDKKDNKGEEKPDNSDAGLDVMERENRACREYYGPPPWEKLGISEQEWKPEIQPDREIAF